MIQSLPCEWHRCKQGTNAAARRRFPSYVYAVDISSDSTKVVAASYGPADNVRLFDITSSTQLLPTISHGYIWTVKFSPDGSRFATASDGSGVRVYSTHDGRVLFDSGTRCSTESSQLVTPLAWSADGQQLFVPSKGKITSFSISDSSSSEWPIHDARYPVSIVSNGRFIACSAGSSVSLWDCMSQKQIGSFITHHAAVMCIALTPSGGYLACGIGNNITIHDLRDVLPSTFFVVGLPLIQVSDQTFKSWTQSIPTNTEALLSEEIKSASSPSHNLLACRAIVRARLKRVALAMEDGKQSLRVQPSPIGYIAMAVALLGQGDREGALRIFDFAFHDCERDDIRFILLLKSILVFESGNQEDAIIRLELLATRADDGNDNDTTYLYTQVLAVMYMKKGNYGRAISLIERAKNLTPEDKQCFPLITISLIFGWSFDGLDVVAQQRLCETLYAEGRTVEAVEILLNIIKMPDKDTQGSKTKADWVADFIQKCAVTLERVGDEASRSAKHDDAITQYSTALSLSPPSPAGLLIKRSKARTAKGLWKDALQDAKEAVKADSSNPWGYEAKHAALHEAKRYDEAIDALNSMLHAIEQSRNPELRQLRKNYISPSDTIAAINSVAREILKHCPLVVIDVTTGHKLFHPRQENWTTNGS
ncbi:hypothetical protein PISMIDRAFT_11981 [Pisolithus microcarpus 441]|uniref:Intraflagellar transport protein 122 homolog n=1 Tax=Pisolithus microcarpus 441 TaxID=765257 RepID=A0A0C9ZH45_9AGAM|nr:hypothetical protein PISMIDRAFT_11981 [Pisolithus microcarpus 441]